MFGPHFATGEYEGWVHFERGEPELTEHLLHLNGLVEDHFQAFSTVLLAPEQTSVLKVRFAPSLGIEYKDPSAAHHQEIDIAVRRATPLAVVKVTPASGLKDPHYSLLPAVANDVTGRTLSVSPRGALMGLG